MIIPLLICIAFSGAATWLILAAVIKNKERNPFSHDSQN
jgi:hypothetical protein